MLRGLGPAIFLLTAMVAAPAVLPDAGAADAAHAEAQSSGMPAPMASDPEAAHPLPFFYDLYTFRGAAGSTAVVAAFAVPAGRLRREEYGGSVRHRFDVTLVLADTTLRTVFRTDDSVFVSLPRPLSGEHLLFTHIEVRAPPSRTTVQRVIMTDATAPGFGQLYTSGFLIPDYSGSHLMLSDIALAQPGAHAGWRRGDATLALLPTGQFPESAFDVYYEIYNLPAGHRYSTEIAVERVDGSGAVPGDGPVRVRYSGQSTAGPDGQLPELRRVDASVGRGRHRITVTITDERTGRSASRSRVFQVSGWRPGATLVAAMPRAGRQFWRQER
jgi:hypothetical protein